MIDLNQIFTVIKKQGATGVLAIWLYYTHSDVQDLKQRLYDCYGRASSTATKQFKDTSTFAIVPKDELIEVEE
jgi:hypothetical protein